MRKRFFRGGGPKSKATTTRGEKDLRPLAHVSARVSDREVSLLLYPRWGCASGTNTVWGTIFGDHKAMMGSPIGGCRKGPSRELWWVHT